MNPPFVTRDKLGEKFETEEQKAVRARIDGAQTLLEATNPEMKGITDKNDRTAPVGRTRPEGNRPGRRRTRNGRTDDRDCWYRAAYPNDRYLAQQLRIRWVDHVTRDRKPEHEPDGRLPVSTKAW